MGDDQMKAKNMIGTGTVVAVCIIVFAFVKHDVPDPIVAEAYTQIRSYNDRQTIADWKNSRYTENDIYYELGHTVWNLETHTTLDLKGRHVYMVIFKVKDNRILGDINVYVDKITGEALGVDLRE
jgi:hypothetical protein